MLMMNSMRSSLLHAMHNEHAVLLQVGYSVWEARPQRTLTEDGLHMQ